MNLDLRPLTVSEFLDRIFSIYRHRFLLVVALMAPQAVPSLIAAMLMAWAQSSLRTPQDFEIENFTGLVLAASFGAVLFSIVHWVLYVLGAAAIASAVSDLYGRVTPDVGTAFSAAMRRLAPLLWATFLMAIRMLGVWVAALLPGGALLGIAAASSALQAGSAVMAGAFMVAAIVLGLGFLVAFCVAVFMALRYAVAIPAVVLEPIRGREAIRRSIRLTRGHLVRALLLVLCAVVIAYAAAMVLQMPFMIAMLAVGPETRTGFWLNMAGTVTGAAGQALTAPIFAIGAVVLYFEARVRHEALDLQVMTEALAVPPAPPGPGYAPVPPPVPT